MFRKILIANRGEIACRIIRTAKRLRLGTVAIYSDADRRALHRHKADEAIHVGESAPERSYLSIDRIMDAVRRSGADAVHPGYGFLSENAELAECLAAEGVTFIGPPAAAIREMGDKIAAKRVAAEAGINIMPGHSAAIASAEEAAVIAAAIGYPVMLKAAAGGGGRGMRIARNDREAREGFDSARREARASFGDDRIFIESFITDPRHVEIQILGDRHGNLIHLGERECSIQRRNQKVIEEAPSPFVDAGMREEMGEQAIALAQAVGYFSAGTVEFIVDGARNFYFLEMNTRLQVEHPVTELVTGIDLVEEMIRIAAGERLSLAQEDVKLDGWAMEARIYAEDPYRNFLPSSGRLTRYRPPSEDARADGAIVRNDAGIYEGGEIPIHYDPMIAKLCASAPDRAGAITAMASALDDFEIEGIGHNLPFLAAIMNHPRFRAGQLTTGFIEEEFPEGFTGIQPGKEDARMLASIAAFIDRVAGLRDAKVCGTRPAMHSASMDRVVTFDGFRLPVRIVEDDNGITVDHGDGASVPVTSDWVPGRTHAHFHIGTRVFGVKTARSGTGWRLRWRGRDVVAHTRRPRIAELAALMPVKLPPDMSKYLLCPMPGIVTSIAVAEGDQVEAGQALAVIEAMKMENVLRAEQKGRIRRIVTSEGASIAADELILEFE